MRRLMRKLTIARISNEEMNTKNKVTNLEYKNHSNRYLKATVQVPRIPDLLTRSKTFTDRIYSAMNSLPSKNDPKFREHEGTRQFF